MDFFGLGNSFLWPPAFRRTGTFIPAADYKSTVVFFCCRQSG
jgi:hypothetical protein